MDISLNFKSISYYKEPFSYAIFKDAFMSSDLLDIDFPSLNQFAENSFRMNGDMSYPEKNYIKLISESQIYNKLHNYIYSTDFISNFLNLFKEDIQKLYKSGQLLYDPFKLPIISTPYETSIFGFENDDKQLPFLYPRLDLGYGVKGYGQTNGGAGIHTDNWGRLISILYYVNKPNKMVGGEHRIYQIDNKLPSLSKIITPEKGLLISSLQTNNALHDVNPVIEIEGSRNAFYLAISCNKKIWNKGENWLMELTSNRKEIKKKTSFKSFFSNNIKKIINRV